MVHSSTSGPDGGAPRELPVRAFLPAAARVAIAPSLWGTAARQLVATSPRGWWRRPPFAPRPDPAYLRFRTETAYGPDARPAPHDLVAYLRWCKGSGR
jgi:hypothetical protein